MHWLKTESRIEIGIGLNSLINDGVKAGGFKWPAPSLTYLSSIDYAQKNSYCDEYCQVCGCTGSHILTYSFHLLALLHFSALDQLISFKPKQLIYPDGKYHTEPSPTVHRCSLEGCGERHNFQTSRRHHRQCQKTLRWTGISGTILWSFNMNGNTFQGKTTKSG